MSETLKAMIVDAATGEITERPHTADELAEQAEIQANFQARQAEADAKVAARISALAKLAALGLTADEVAAL
jgi:hypothetical protein